MSSLSVGIFTSLIQYFPKNTALSVQNFFLGGGGYDLGYFKTKKNPTAIKFGGALIALPLKK